MTWRKLNGTKLDQPISEAVDHCLKEELAKGNRIKVCIGTDSQVYSSTIGFATVIVFLREGQGGFMYIKSEVRKQEMTIRERMITEVAKSVTLAYELSDVWNRHAIKPEIHADINTDPAFKSNVALKEAVGYIKGMGYQIRVKPDAFASSSCADKVV
jgi:uncharacterized protein